MDSGLTPVVSGFTGRTSSEPAPARPLLETLEHYKLGARLGQGGMAEVFLAAHEVAPFVHRPVVVKRLHAHFAEEPNLVQMFLDEARLLCLLDHPNIVKTLEAGIIDGRCCIAMEYLEGQPLHLVLRRAFDGGKLPVELALHITTSILEGLHYAHWKKDDAGTSLGIVHRDISPHNVFVTLDGDVKILDFGIAKASTHEAHTANGVVKGKAGYLAPEQARSAPVDSRADLFSVGVILWEALTGARLFRADTEAGTIRQTLEREIPPASSLRPELSVTLDVVLSRALARNPDHRYRAALEMKRDLNAWASRTNSLGSREALGTAMRALFAHEIVEQHRQVSMLIALSDSAPSSIRFSSSAPASEDPGSTGALAVSAAPKSTPGGARKRTRGPAMFLGVAALCALVSAGIVRLVVGRSRAPAPPSAENETAEVATRAPSAEGNTNAVLVPGPPSVAPRVSNDLARRDTPVTQPAVVEAAGAGAPRAAATEPQLTESPFAKLRQVSLVPRARAPSTEPSVRASAPAADPDAFGFLTLDSSPWATVSLNGKLMGQTPIVGAKLPAGTHVLTLKNPELGQATSYIVTIVAGKTTVKRIGLE